MTRGRSALGALLAVALLGCGSGPSEDEVTMPGASDPAVVAPPVEVASLGSDPYAVRDLLVGSVASAGAVRMSVSGLPAEMTVDLVWDARRERFARRFAWTLDGRALELLELRTRQVCANRPATDALTALGDNVQGAIVGDGPDFSCSDRGDGSVPGFVMSGNAQRDPVTRLSRLMGELTMTDLGSEEVGDAGATRHVQLAATETDPSGREVPTTWDLWVDADRRLVRAVFTSLADGGVHTARFDYEAEPAPVVRPPGAGRLVFAPGTGVPGFGGYLLGQSASS